MRRFHHFVEQISHSYTINTSIVVLIATSVWSGLAIAMTMQYIRSGDGFEILMGIANLVVSSTMMLVDALVLRALIRRQSDVFHS